MSLFFFCFFLPRALIKSTLSRHRSHSRFNLICAPMPAERSWARSQCVLDWRAAIQQNIYWFGSIWLNIRRCNVYSVYRCGCSEKLFVRAQRTIQTMMRAKKFDTIPSLLLGWKRLSIGRWFARCTYYTYVWQWLRAWHAHILTQTHTQSTLIMHSNSEKRESFKSNAFIYSSHCSSLCHPWFCEMTAALPYAA